MVIIPFFMILNNLFLSQKNVKKVLAVNLAERELETCLIKQDFTNSKTQYTSSGFHFIIQRKIQIQGRLAIIIMEIIDKEKGTSLIMFKTFHHYDPLSRPKQIFGEE
jgi:hypothetical protein